MQKVIYGINPVFEALQAKKLIIDEVIAQSGKENKRIKQIVEIAEEKNITVRYAERKEIVSICGGNHQGVLAVISTFSYSDYDELLAGLRAADSARLLFLDCVEDPQNLGTLIRSASAFFFDAVVIQSKRSATVTASVIRTSSGAAFHIPICQVNNITHAINAAQDAGFWSVGMSLKADKYLQELNCGNKVALVIGNEEKGLRSLVEKNCDFLVKIPIHERVNSLNASAAGACAMYEIIRGQNTK